MQVYQAFNLYIASEIPLPELIESEGQPDVIIRLGKLDGTTEQEFDLGNNFQGTVADVGRFLIVHGQEIVLEPIPGVEESLLRTILLGPILCVLLRQRGLLVLHASAVKIHNQAVAFMGGSGWGKSTLATAFHTQGYDVLTDDVMPIQIGKPPLVFPAYPQFKLWPEAATSLGEDVNNLSPIFPNAPKLSYKLSQGFQQTPLALQKIYVLGKGERHEITKIAPQQAFIELVRHTRAITLITDPQFQASHLKLCTELVKNVEFCRFNRKPSLADLPELVKLVEADLAMDNLTTV